MKRILFVLIFLQVCFGFGQSISLRQAVEKGLKMSPEIDISTFDRDAGELGLKKSKRARLFSVSASGVYRYQSLVPELDMTKVFSASPFVPPVAQSMGAYNNYDASLKVVQPIYTGGALSSMARSAENIYASSEDLREMTVISKTAEIKQIYYSYRLMQQKKASTTALISQLKLHLKQLNSLFSEGLALKRDVLETETKIDEMMLKQYDIDNEIRDRAVLFKSMCGIEISDIDSSSIEPDIEFKDALEYFSNHHPVVKSLNHLILAQAALKKAVLGSYLPNIAGFFEYHYARPGIDFLNDKWNSYFFCGVSINMPIFQWNKIGIDMSIADIQVKKAETKRNEFLRDQKVRINQLFNLKNSIKTKLKRVKDLVEKSNQQVDILSKLYKEGQIAHIEYLRAMEQQEKYNSMVQELGTELNICNVSIDAAIGFTGEIK